MMHHPLTVFILVPLVSAVKYSNETGNSTLSLLSTADSLFSSTDSLSLPGPALETNILNSSRSADATSTGAADVLSGLSDLSTTDSSPVIAPATSKSTSDSSQGLHGVSYNNSTTLSLQPQTVFSNASGSNLGDSSRTSDSFHDGVVTPTITGPDGISNYTKYPSGYRGGHPGNYTYSLMTNTSSLSNSTTTGIGSAYASSCNSASNEWKSSSRAFLYGPPTTETSTRIFDRTVSLGPVITYCKTAVYANGNVTSYETVHDTITYELVNYDYGLVTPTTPFTNPGPACAIGKSDCEELLRSRATANTQKLKDTFGHLYLMEEWPNCNLAPFQCDTCTIVGGHVEVIYFPVPTSVSRDMCADEPTNHVPTPAPMAPGQRSGIVDGTRTYYADKAYVSFQVLGAMEYCPGRGVGSTQIGTWRSGDIVEFESSELFTLREPNYGTAYPFNFADLNDPVPRSAYMGISYCYYQQCATVGRFDYKPMLAVPAKLRGLDPLWANCAMDFNGVYDPPKALSSASLLTDTPKSDVPAQVTTTSNKASTVVGTETKLVLQSSGSPIDTASPGQRVTSYSEPTNAIPAVDPSKTGVGKQKPDPIAAAIMAGLGGTPSPIDVAQEIRQTVPESPLATVGTSAMIGSNPVLPAVSQPGAVQIGSSIHRPGDSGILEETPLSVGTANIVLGSTNNAVTVAIPTGSKEAESALIADGEILSANPSGPGVVAGSLTLTAGGSAATFDGTVFSAGTSGLFVVAPGASEQMFSIPSAGPVWNSNTPGLQNTQPEIFAPMGSATVNLITDKLSIPQLAIGTQTLSSGGPALTTSGIVYSVGPNGIVVSTLGNNDAPSIYPFSSFIAAVSGGLVVTIGSHIMTAMPLSGSSSVSELVIGGATLRIGGAPAIIDGTVLSLGSSGLVIESSTLRIGDIPTIVDGTVLSLGSSGLIIEGTTLRIGGSAATVDGTVLSLGSSGLIIGGTTLRVGGTPATIDGTVLSLGSSGLVIGGTKTIPLPSTKTGLSGDNATPTTGVSISGTSVSLSASTGSVESFTSSTQSGGNSLYRSSWLTGYLLLLEPIAVSFSLLFI